jgi:hypothetical protein
VKRDVCFCVGHGSGLGLADCGWNEKRWSFFENFKRREELKSWRIVALIVEKNVGLENG